MVVLFLVKGEKGSEKHGMNIQSKITKLLLALRMKGRIVGMNTKQFYAEDSQRMITKYEIGEISEQAKIDNKIITLLYSKLKSKKLSEEEREEIEQEIQILEEEYNENYINGVFFKKIDILYFLVNWYKKVGDTS